MIKIYKHDPLRAHNLSLDFKVRIALKNKRLDLLEFNTKNERERLNSLGLSVKSERLGLRIKF